MYHFNSFNKSLLNWDLTSSHESLNIFFPKRFHEFRSKKKSDEVLISEFMDSDVRITSTVLLSVFARLAGYQAVRISFRKTSTENIRTKRDKRF